MRYIIKTIAVMMVFSVGFFSATNADADPIEHIIVTGSYNGPTYINGMAWYDWANLQNNINYTGNYYTDAATVAAAVQAGIDAGNATPPTPAEETRNCEQAIDANVVSCQSNFTYYNGGIAMLCTAVMLRTGSRPLSEALGAVTYASVCDMNTMYLNRKATQWCATTGATQKNNTCY